MAGGGQDTWPSPDLCPYLHTQVWALPSGGSARAHLNPPACQLPEDFFLRWLVIGIQNSPAPLFPHATSPFHVHISLSFSTFEWDLCPFYCSLPWGLASALCRMPFESVTWLSIPAVPAQYCHWIGLLFKPVMD